MKKGIKRIILPKESANEAAIVDEIDVYGFDNLTEVISFLNEESNPEKTITNKDELFSAINNYHLDFSDVKGQENVKAGIRSSSSRCT